MHTISFRLGHTNVCSNLLPTHVSDNLANPSFHFASVEACVSGVRRSGKIYRWLVFAAAAERIIMLVSAVQWWGKTVNTPTSQTFATHSWLNRSCCFTLDNRSVDSSIKCSLIYFIFHFPLSFPPFPHNYLCICFMAAF